MCVCVCARSRVRVLIALKAVGVKGLGKMSHYGIGHVCLHTLYMYPCPVAVTFVSFKISSALAQTIAFWACHICVHASAFMQFLCAYIIIDFSSANICPHRRASTSLVGCRAPAEILQSAVLKFHVDFSSNAMFFGAFPKV